MAGFKPAKFGNRPAADDEEKSGFVRASFTEAPPDNSLKSPMDGYEYTGDIEVDAKEEMSRLKQGFIDRAKAEDKRRELATDSEYWVCICFQSRPQVEAWLRATGFGAVTDKYIDGQKVAKKMGIEIPKEEPLTERYRISKDWSDLALPIGPDE